MEKLQEISAAEVSRYLLMAASLPLALLSTMELPTMQATPASTSGMATPGTNSVATSMANFGETETIQGAAINGFLYPPTAPSSPLALRETTAAMATIQATHASTNGMATPGTNSATTSMANFGQTPSDGLSHSPTTAPSSPLALIATTAVATIQATHASTNGMATPGTNSVATSMARLQETDLAPTSRSQPTAPSLLLALTQTMAMARMPATHASTNGMATPGTNSATTLMARRHGTEISSTG